MDFYKVECLENGGYKIKKLKKKHAFIKDGRCFDEKKKIIPLDLDTYNAAKLIYIKDNRAYAGEYGEINRIRIIQKDRLDVFHDRYDYFGIKDGMGQNNEEEFKEDRYYRLLTDLYNEVFLKATDKFDESGGCIILDAYESNGFIYKYFSREEFFKVRTILSKYIKPEHIPVFLSDGVETKKEDWWQPLSFVKKE